jgi:hypothetical protein
VDGNPTNDVVRVIESAKRAFLPAGDLTLDRKTSGGVTAVRSNPSAKKSLPLPVETGRVLLTTPESSTMKST